MNSAGVGIRETYLFKTREGATGIFRIVGFTDEPKGMKIRYKLVQNLE